MTDCNSKSYGDAKRQNRRSRCGKTKRRQVPDQCCRNWTSEFQPKHDPRSPKQGSIALTSRGARITRDELGNDIRSDRNAVRGILGSHPQAASLACRLKIATSQVQSAHVKLLLSDRTLIAIADKCRHS